jgi:N-acetylmuramoyl-L-alanine amidase CwlA
LETDIVRHYDVTRKNCPAPWVEDVRTFDDLKKRLVTSLMPKKNELEEAPRWNLVNYSSC